MATNETAELDISFSTIDIGTREWQLQVAVAWPPISMQHSGHLLHGCGTGWAGTTAGHSYFYIGCPAAGGMAVIDFGCWVLPQVKQSMELQSQ